VLPVSIFDGPFEEYGADISNLHKRIMEERNEFKPRGLSQRAANLRELKRPVFKISPQRLARPQHPLYARTME
jgi:hypothetical protein